MEYIKTFFLEILHILNEMSPYLLLGFLFAGILKVYLPQKFIDKHLSKSNFKSVFYAALLGVPMPLCSCGVIPTGVSIYKNGASKGSAVSFLISTPQTGVDSILVTYSLLGLPFAIVRPIVALITGIFGGMVTNAYDKDNNNSKEKTNITANCNTDYSCCSDNSSSCSYDSCCSEDSCSTSNNYRSKVYTMFKYAFVDFLQDIAKWLIIGILIAAVISILIPNNFFEQFIGNRWLEMVIILIVAIPLYVCATGSIPIVAALMLKGLSPGAALVFLMAGPATNAATITVLGKTIGKKSMYSYLASIIVGAFVFGTIVNMLPAQWFNIESLQHGHAMGHLPGWLSWSCTIILTLLIINAFYQKKKKTKAMIKSIDNQKEIVVTIHGMTCNHCKNSVESHISSLPGVKSAKVNLDKKILVMKGENIDMNQVKAEIKSLGFEYIGDE